MPLYDFNCKSCNSTFEELVKSNSSIPKCKYCKSDNVIKLVSNYNFILKGSGWYKTTDKK